MTPELEAAITATVNSAGLGYIAGLAFLVFVAIARTRKGGD